MQVLSLLLGWLLGTLSPGIVEAIKRPKRRDALLSALATDLQELRFTIALVYDRLRAKSGSLNRADLALLAPVYGSYVGDGDDKALAEGLRQLLAKGEDAYILEMNSTSVAARDSLPIRYEASLLHAVVAESTLFPTALLIRILRVDSRLRMFNEQVAVVHKHFDRSFTTSGTNHEINSNNFSTAQRMLTGHARRLLEAINAVITPTGARRP